MREIGSREIRLKTRPRSLPSLENFELVETRIPVPRDGQVLVCNLYLSVDPYMRGRMLEHSSHNVPFPLHQPLEGACVGQVVQSKKERFQVGDYVVGEKGWREYYISDGSDLTKLNPHGAPLRTYLGSLGLPGLTAYVGLYDIGQLQAGETIFVSAAAGAVGMVVCQIAKLKDCRVVASVGTEEKVVWLQKHGGVAVAFNYKKVESLTDALREYCPNGIDLYFDNVGGPHLEAALEQMNPFGRIVLCGMISQVYADGRPFGLSNLSLAVRKRLTLKGFRVSDHLHRLPEFHTNMSVWMREGKVTWKETLVDGIEHAPRAFLGLFTGENLGKMLVRLPPALKIDDESGTTRSGDKLDVSSGA